ncbi:MAG: hypothetical protein S4CHLAM37_15390 [Chlamydiia bacterium]|nr:hypothetical protein [Chlamydiia bacterium]
MKKFYNNKFFHMKNHPYRKWIIWSLAVFFYFYEYFLRVSPSLMVDNLMKDFHINAAMVGIISAFYFYIYALMQLPVGLMMDRYGSRRLLTFGALACGIGGILFGIAFKIYLLDIARLLQGAGSAFAFVGMVYICSHWFEASRLAFLVGLGNSVGMLGAVIGEGPISFAVSGFGWRPTIIVIGIVGLALAVLIFLVVRNEPPHVEKHGRTSIKNLHIGNHLKLVCSNWKTWVNAIIGLSFLITTIAFAGLWGVPFLETAYHTTKEVASFGISVFFIGWIIGGPLIGHYSDRIGKRRPIFIFCGIATCLLMSILIYYPYFSIYIAYLVLFGIGFFSSAQNLSYCVAIELNPIQTKGTAISLTNFVIYTGGAIIQPVVGAMIVAKWAGKTLNGIPVYSISDYQFALTCFPIFFLIAAIAAIFLKEKAAAT